MVSVGTVIGCLPVRDREQLVVVDQDDRDIIKYIRLVHDKFALDYDNIYKFFDQGDVYHTSECIWNFLKDNLKYHAETIHDQTVRSPYRILQSGDKVDCKHYSLFIGGVLSAIQRSGKCDWDWTYRFASYNNDSTPAHVFVVVIIDGKELWVDPVLDSFNEDKNPTYWIDKKPMALYILSGINGKGGAIGAVTGNKQVVAKQAAIDNFLVWVELNLFEMKALFRQYPDIVNGPVKAYFQQQGFPFDTLLRLLNA